MGEHRTNVPKLIARAEQIKSIFVGSILMLGCIAAGIYIYSRTHNPAAIYLLGGLGISLALLSTGLSLLFLQRLSVSADLNPQFHQFQMSTGVSYRQDLPNATVTPDEQIVNWLGPVDRRDGWASSYQILGREVVLHPENTLLITNRQIVGLMFGPQDAVGLPAVGPIRGLLGAAVNLAPQDASTKATQFQGLYYSRWGDMVQRLLAQPASAFLSNYYNIGIPYTSIRQVGLRQGRINPGLILYMHDGKKIKYLTLRPDLLPQFAASLRQFAAVVQEN